MPKTQHSTPRLTKIIGKGPIIYPTLLNSGFIFISQFVHSIGTQLLPNGIIQFEFGCFGLAFGQCRPQRQFPIVRDKNSIEPIGRKFGHQERHKRIGQLVYADTQL
jgi:hypothetical protein